MRACAPCASDPGQSQRTLLAPGFYILHAPRRAHRPRAARPLSAAGNLTLMPTLLAAAAAPPSLQPPIPPLPCPQAPARDGRKGADARAQGGLGSMRRWHAQAAPVLQHSLSLAAGNGTGPSPVGLAIGGREVADHGGVCGNGRNPTRRGRERRRGAAARPSPTHRLIVDGMIFS